jgi:hypothetical protein
MEKWALLVMVLAKGPAMSPRELAKPVVSNRQFGHVAHNCPDKRSARAAMAVAVSSCAKSDAP